MLKIDDVFADFQYVGHKAKKMSFVYPKEGLDPKKYDFNIDFEVVHTDEERENYFGVVRFLTCIHVNDVCFLETEIEGVFVGNKAAYEFKDFVKMLKYNGVATLSQISRLQIMNMTTNVGIDTPIVVPMINVVAMNEQKSK